MGEPIRCLVIIPSLVRGGAEYQALLTAGALSTVGVESHLFVCAPPLDLQSETEYGDVAIDRPAGKEGRLRQLSRLSRHLDSFRPDVVITFMFSASARFFATRKVSSWGRRATWIASERGCIHLEEVLRKTLVHRVQKAYLRACDLVAVNSSALATNLFAFEDSIGTKVTILPNVVVPFSSDRTAAIERLRPLLPPGFSGTLLGTIGSFQADRNHMLLLEAFIRVRRTVPDAHLLVMGMTTGPYCQASATRFRKGMEEAGLLNCITMAGDVSRARELLAGLDVAVFPSKLEGSSNGLMEAIVSSAAVASAPFADAEELLAGSGIVSKGWTPAAFAEAMCEAVASRDRLRALAARRGVELLAQRGKERMGLAWKQVAEAALLRRNEQA
jgi:glycosyltransferase involved in cell wall biosynthesis